MQGRIIKNKHQLFLLITIFVIVTSYILIQFFKYRNSLFVFKEFTNELIVGYGSFFRTEPDSITDFIEFAHAPNFDWNQYTPPYRTFDSIKMLKLLTNSNLRIENNFLNIYLKQNCNKSYIEHENYSLFDYFWSDKNIVINRFSLDHRKVGNRGMYNLELFKDYNRVNDTILEYHFNRKLRKFHQDHFNTYILPTFNLDSTTLFFHVKKTNNDFVWKVIYNPMNLSANKADSIFQLLKVDYLNDSLTIYFDRINIPVIMSEKK